MCENELITDSGGENEPKYNRSSILELYRLTFEKTENKRKNTGKNQSENRKYFKINRISSVLSGHLVLSRQFCGS